MLCLLFVHLHVHVSVIGSRYDELLAMNVFDYDDHQYDPDEARDRFDYFEARDGLTEDQSLIIISVITVGQSMRELITLRRARMSAHVFC